MSAIKNHELQLRQELVEFIDEKYPKGISKERGTVALTLALFILWLDDKAKVEVTR